jgi:3-oxoacyl-[acyl-carrier-protein] synthase II
MQDDVNNHTNGNGATVGRRVAITGIGVISPLGSDPNKCFEQLLSGTSAVCAYPEDASPVHGLRVAAVVKDFDAAAVVGKKNIKRTARFLQMGLACARAARADSQLAEAGYASDRIGSLFGSSLGGLEMVNENAGGFLSSGLRGVTPFLLPGALNNMAAGMIAIDAAVHGPCYAISAGWASSTIAIGQAFEMVRRGVADAMLAGGSESLADSPLATALLGKSGYFTDVASDGAAASKPFDVSRTGLVAAEGGTVLVLESLEHAKARGATVYAEVLGYASTYAPMAPTERTGWSGPMIDCMRAALRSAAIAPAEIEYINSYGSSSRYTDVMETSAVKEVFGAAAVDKKLWLSSNKGATGHMLGASGAFETAMTSLTLKRGMVPPTANLHSQDPECDLDYMAGAARERRITIAMKNTFAESGHCSSLILRVAA